MSDIVSALNKYASMLVSAKKAAVIITDIGYGAYNSLVVDLGGNPICDVAAVNLDEETQCTDCPIAQDWKAKKGEQKECACLDIANAFAQKFSLYQMEDGKRVSFYGSGVWVFSKKTRGADIKKFFRHFAGYLQSLAKAVSGSGEPCS